VGDPKSIVLFNNGKIGAIPTPANGRVGMVVTVKYRSLLKILIITCAAVLLIAVGVFIGVVYSGGNAAQPAPEMWRGRHNPMMEQFRRPEHPPPDGQWRGGMDRRRMWRGEQNRMMHE